MVYTLNFFRTRVCLKRYLGPEYTFQVDDQFSGKRLSVCCTIVLCLETFYCECVLLPNDTIYLYTCFMINLTQHIVSFSMFPDHLRPNTVDSSTCLYSSRDTKPGLLCTLKSTTRPRHAVSSEAWLGQHFTLHHFRLHNTALHISTLSHTLSSIPLSKQV